MMYIGFSGGKVMEWHVGKPTGFVAEMVNKGCKVKEVQADGDELEHVIKNFAGVPVTTHKRSIIWHGDFAKFIAHNL